MFLLYPDAQQLTYTVAKPDWRHSDLHNWLKVLGQLHHRNHDPKWLEGRELYMKHVLCPKMEQYNLDHPSDMIA